MPKGKDSNQKPRNDEEERGKISSFLNGRSHEYVASGDHKRKHLGTPCEKTGEEDADEARREKSCLRLEDPAWSNL